MLSEWNKFVQKVYREGKQKNPNYKFKDALSDASARKGEMGKPSVEVGSVGTKSRKSRRSRKAARKSCMKKCKQMCKTQKMRGGKRGRGRKGGCHTNHPLMPANFPGDGNVQ